MAEFPNSWSEDIDTEYSDSCRHGVRNTIEEKKAMRNARKKRRREERRRRQEEESTLLSKRLQIAQDKAELEEKRRKIIEKDAAKYQGMARTYYDRFCWELHRRKEAQKELRLDALKQLSSNRKSNEKGKEKSVFLFNEIDEANLEDPVFEGERQDVYLGRGSFGIVKLQMYRGLKVAVKRYLPRTVIDDVKREASFLLRICHSSLPLLVGITSKNQLSLVMQFHGIDHKKASTLWTELKEHKLISAGSGWLILTIQILEAVRYLHTNANILHNDIKADNVLISATCESWVNHDDNASSSQIGCSSDFGFSSCAYHAILIDFGKACTMKEVISLKLSDSEKHVYRVRHPSIAPEVVDGLRPFSTKSDMYAVGHMIRQISGKRRYYNLPSKTQCCLMGMAERCLLSDFSQRPEASLLKQESQSLVLTVHEADGSIS